MTTLLRMCALAAAVAAIGCSSEPTGAPAPLDKFTFPTGIAVQDGRLLVVSSNFDLAFASADGGSVLSVDPAPTPAAFGAGVRIGSFGGEIAVVRDQSDAVVQSGVAPRDPTVQSCGLPAGTAPFALVASRVDDQVYRLDLSGGGVACGAGCALPAASSTVTDPYGLAVTCPPGGPARGWVGMLRTPGAQSWLGVFDLADPAGKVNLFELPTTTGNGTPRSFAYDQDHDRLFFTSTNSGTSASLRWIDLGGGCTPGADPLVGGCPVGLANLSASITGAELTGIALGRTLPDGTQRLYVTARLYDANLAASIGFRPPADVGGALLVLDVGQAPDGGALVEVDRIVSAGVVLGLSEVRVIPRTGRPDLVVATAPEAGDVWLYDDDVGSMSRVFSRATATGAPVLGEQPFGIAAQPLASAAVPTVRLYVGSFIDGFVTPVDVPLDAPASATIVMDLRDPTKPRRIGQEQP